MPVKILDGKVKKKFQSSWDLTPKEIAKNEKKLKKKKVKQRPSVKLTKGLKELMNLADPLMTREQSTLGEPTMKSLAIKKESSENDDLKALSMETEPQNLMNGDEYKSGMRYLTLLPPLGHILFNGIVNQIFQILF